MRIFVSGGGAGAAVLHRALGALWIADAPVKPALPFSARPADQWYEQSGHAGAIAHGAGIPG